MLNYPLSYIVYITASLAFSILLYFTLPTLSLSIFIVLALLFMILSLVALYKNKSILSFLFVIFAVFFLSYIYTSYRYKHIENEVSYEKDIDAFTCKVLSYDGEFLNDRNIKRERYICEVYSIHYRESSTSSFEKTYFRIRLYNSSKKEIKINDRLIVNSKINLYKNILTNENSNYDNEAIINALENKMLIGVSSIYRNERFIIEKRTPSIINVLNYYSKKIREYVKLSLTDNIDERNKSIILSIVLGDKTKLTNDTRLLFSNVGLLHILAVSGLHLSIVVLIFNCFLFFIVRREMRRLNIAIILSLLIFPASTLFSVSIVRASIMYFLILLSNLFGKKLNSLHNLFLTALIILVSNPIAILDMSFQFSFLATLGIITYYPAYKSIIKNKLVEKLSSFITISIFAVLIISPLSIYYFNGLNLNSIISNIYATFYSFIIIMLTFINTAIYILLPKLAIYSSSILDRITSSFIFVLSKQESFDILKYNISINIYTAITLTLIFSLLGMILQCIASKKSFNKY